MGERLVLKDGTTIDGASAALTGGYLWLWIPGWTMRQAADVMFDPDRTGKIWYMNGEETINEFTGYTNCVTLMTEDGQISVCMTKG